MIVGRSKSKGNNFENKIAKMLSLWLTYNQKPDVLERSPTSGAKATINRKQNRNHENIAGDIISVAPEGMPLTQRFVIELKHQARESLNVEALIFQSSKGGVLAYWEKLLGECKTTQRLPILIFRQNTKPILVACCKRGIELFEAGKLVHAIIKQPGSSMYIMTLDIFIAKVNPKKLFQV